MIGRMKRDWSPWILAGAVVGMWALMHLLLGGSFFGPSVYNTYTRQAMAWRQGLLHLPEDVPYLELAVYKGEYYVSFPPLPSLVLLPLTFIFGMDTPDNLLVKLYALSACLMIHRTLKRAGYGKTHAGLISFLFCFASSLLPLTMNGAVWYHAQVLSFCLLVFSVCLLTEDKPTLSLLCCALSVGCRPFNALYLIPWFFSWFSLNLQSRISFKEALRPLIPGVCLGLLVAVEMGIYNFARFGDPLEFGHNYLPEFSTQGGVQFSMDHVLKNLRTFLWGLPFDLRLDALQVNFPLSPLILFSPTLTLLLTGYVLFTALFVNPGVLGDFRIKTFGFSMLLSCPALTLMLIGGVIDLFKKRFRPEKAVVLLTCIAHAFFLLMHRTFGGYQLGARYAVDLMPYALFFLLLTPEKKKAHFAEYAFLVLVFALTVWGMSQMGI